MSKFDWFLWISHSTLFTACAGQLLYSPKLIKGYSACVKQNTAVKTAINDCSLLAKYTFSYLVGEGASSLIINFEQVIKPFLVWNIYFTFFLSVDDCPFYKRTIKSNCVLLLCHVRVRTSRKEVFCKKGVLRSFAKFTGKHFCQSLFFKKETLAQVFSCEFCEISKNTFPYRHLRRLLLEFQNESTLYRFRTSCSKQGQYLKFQWTVTSWKYSRSNIVQTSSLCYATGL